MKDWPKHGCVVSRVAFENELPTRTVDTFFFDNGIAFKIAPLGLDPGEVECVLQVNTRCDTSLQIASR